MCLICDFCGQILSNCEDYPHCDQAESIRCESCPQDDGEDPMNSYDGDVKC